jgi:hypothetical protein
MRKRRNGHALARRYGRARARLDEKAIAERLVSSADRLFNGRVELRQDQDILADAYDDASGLGAQNMYADTEVKRVRDEIRGLDTKIGAVARDMEGLARKLKKGERSGWSRGS